jgi:hypothetical protein
MARHTVEVPDSLWAYFQQISGNKVPGNAIRDALYEYRINHPPISVYTGPMVDTTLTNATQIVKPVAFRLRALDMLPDPIDYQFTRAFETFVNANAGDLSVALSYLETLVERGMKNPRAWLIDWYKNAETATNRVEAVAHP